jgi:hypothetical protein
MGKLAEWFNRVMIASAPRSPEEVAQAVPTPAIEPLFEFTAWPKTARLLRDVVITEKLDGTNGAILIQRVSSDRMIELLSMEDPSDGGVIAYVGTDEGDYWAVGAQSRNRLVNVHADNQGFAKWVLSHARTLIEDLGEGRHYGEFWGNKIGRGYGLPDGERRFSLFNPSFGFGENYGYPKPSADGTYQVQTPGLSKVPLLYEGPLDTDRISHVLRTLQENGSYAARGFDRPEGIVVYHTHARRILGKVTLDNQDAGKWEQE